MLDRDIPGTTEIAGREFRYVADDGSGQFFDRRHTGLFARVTEAVKPFVPSSGGAITEAVHLRLPSGELFHGLSYKGDLDGWRAQIEGGAALLGLATAEIIDGVLVLSDGRSLPLSTCAVTFSDS